ncbi:SDR family NAD(P)-dependent oxidoreductase, partial [Streptomyces sp. NPDC018000]|uniref:type I polyketide synthase n=1 Tax=Streptomyces sp. NPDC018000 TaxID=3365028 RepID=UPI0037A33C11
LKVSHAFHSPLMDPMLDEFERVVNGLTFHEPTLPVVSNVTGQLATPAGLTSPRYWVRHVRVAVRFADGIRALAEDGVTTFLEIGPDAVLTAMASEALPEDGGHDVVPLLRRSRPEEPEALTALARLWAHGHTVDWTTLHTDGQARPVDLPTYPFQRRHYWLEDAPGGPADVTALGQSGTHHPLLGAVLHRAGADETILTGSLNAHTHPWLADHRIMGTVLLPGTALVELAIHAGDHTGTPHLEELTLQAPLILPEDQSLDLQVTVGAPDNERRRTLTIHSRLQSADAPWTQHAEGTLTPQHARGDADGDLTAWPPPNAKPIALRNAYEALADQGYHYGPTFQGLTAAWSEGNHVYAEVTLSQEAHRDAGAFGVHPALLDSALHANLFDEGGSQEDAAGPRLPFAWSGVTVHAAGATALRVRVTSRGLDEASVLAADSTGAPVISIRSLAARAVSAEQLAAAGNPGDGAEALLRLTWSERVEWSAAEESTGSWAVVGTAADEGIAAAFGDDVPVFADLAALRATVGPVPEHVVLICAAGTAGDGADGLLDRMRAATTRVLETVQGWLADTRFADSRLVVLTSGVTGPEPVRGAVVDLVDAPLAGLVRAAQAERPEARMLLLDWDGITSSQERLRAAATADGAELALREGALWEPRLVREQQAPAGSLHAARLDPEGTVLITGGTGGLGAAVARHLADRHGVRHLLLVSRRGENAPGAEELRSELAESGAKAHLAACDVADRAAVEKLLGEIPAAHPLTAVVHTAGVADNGLIETQTARSLDAVMRPKADAAWHLHELTHHQNLAAFVMFSSTAGLFVGAGQANYGASNVFLDALARHRAAEGLPGLSLAWGLWSETSGMAGELGEADLERMRRMGLRPLATGAALNLLDASLAVDAPVLVPVGVETAVIGSPGGPVPPLLRTLVRTPVRRAASSAAPAPAALSERLSALEAADRNLHLLDLVRENAAAVLGHYNGELLDPERSFKDIGFDSLAAVDLRNLLNAATGLRLPATLVFDFPTPAVLAAHLAAELVPALPSGQPLSAEIDRLESVLLASPLSDGGHEGEYAEVAARLETLLRKWRDRHGSALGAGVRTDFDSATDDELFAALDGEVGLP